MTTPNNNQQIENLRIVDFAAPADHGVKLKKCEKKDKYLDLYWELKKQRNMKMTVIPIVIGALSTFTKADEWRPSKLQY